MKAPGAAPYRLTTRQYSDPQALLRQINNVAMSTLSKEAMKTARSSLTEAMMSGSFDGFDDLGPAKIIQVFEPKAAVRGFLVVDNVACGPSIGGLRMAPDASLVECRRLARAMTLKNAAAGLPHGGGKSVLIADPRIPVTEKAHVVRSFAHALRNERDYIFGPDMGTNESCMAWVKDEIGRSVGLPRELGGIPLDELGATGWGVTASIEVAAKELGLPLEGATVAIQGYGAVGRHTARFLADRGAIITAASDSRGTVFEPNGLNLDALDQAKRAGLSVADAGLGAPHPGDAIIDAACDIWIPAARPDVISESNVDRLRTRIVAQGANIPLTEGAERRLHARGVLSLPDFIANAGGVICAAMEYTGSTQRSAFDAIAKKVSHNTAVVLERSSAQGQTPREAAVSLAEERIRSAMQMRRFNIM